MAWSEVQTQAMHGDVKAVSELQCFKGEYGYGRTLVTSLPAAKVIQPRQVLHFDEDVVLVALATIWRIISQKYWEKMGKWSTKNINFYSFKPMFNLKCTSSSCFQFHLEAKHNCFHTTHGVPRYPWELEKAPDGEGCFRPCS